MQLEIRDKEGVFGTIEVTPEKAQELRELLGSGTASAESEAQLKESQDKVTELEAQRQAGPRTMDDFTSDEKAYFVINWAKTLPLEDKVLFAVGVGVVVAETVKAEVAEAKQKAEAAAAEAANAAEAEEKEGPAAEAEEKVEPEIIVGETDLPGYKYFKHLNMSMKE